MLTWISTGLPDITLKRFPIQHKCETCDIRQTELSVTLNLSQMEFMMRELLNTLASYDSEPLTWLRFIII